jgi:DNA polymerase-1
LEDPAILKVGQNFKYDLAVFQRYGVRVAPYDDTMLISYVQAAGLHNHGMDELSERHLGHKCISFKEVCGTGKSQKRFSEIDLKTATEYAAEDADVTLRLWELLKAGLAGKGLSTVYETLERPLPQVLTDMELAGVKVDVAQLSRLSSDFAQKMAEAEETAHGWRATNSIWAAPSRSAKSCSERWACPAARKPNPAPGRRTPPCSMSWLSRAMSCRRRF